MKGAFTLDVLLRYAHPLDFRLLLLIERNMKELVPWTEKHRGNEYIFFTRASSSSHFAPDSIPDSSLSMWKLGST